VIRVTNQYRWEGNVESVDVEGDWLIMHPETMTITKLEDVAAYIWSNLKNPATATEVVDAVLSEFAVSREVAEPEVEKFLSELMQIGLLEVVDAHMAL
jgi:hypothetical protein